MFSYPLYEEGLALRLPAVRAASGAAPIDFYLGLSDNEEPLTGRSLRRVLEARSGAANAEAAALRPIRRLSPQEANPVLLGVLRSPLSDPVDVRAVSPRQGIDPFANLSEEERWLIGPVLDAALRDDSGDEGVCTRSLHPVQAEEDDVSEEVLRYLQTLPSAAQSMSMSMSIARVDASFGDEWGQMQAMEDARTRGRVRETTRLLRLLAAVVHLDIALPPTPSTVEDELPQYDARFLLCAAYRAIALNVQGKPSWLSLKQFTDALDIDLSTFTRWTVQYRQDEGASNAFWETLAPYAWSDAFALIEALEAAKDEQAPTSDDLARTALSGRLRLGRVKRPRARVQEAVHAWLDATVPTLAQRAGSRGGVGTDRTVTHTEARVAAGAEGARGAAIDAMGGEGAIGAMHAAAATSHDGGTFEADVAAFSAAMSRESPEPTFEALQDIAWRVRLVAAAAAGKIKPERIVAHSGDLVRRYDPRYLLIAVYEALADNLQRDAKPLKLRTILKIVGLNARTVYAWRYAYLRNSAAGAAFGRRLVAGSGSDKTAFLAALEAVMQEPAPAESDLYGTPLQNRLLQRYESTLRVGVSEAKGTATRRARKIRIRRSVPNMTSASQSVEHHAASASASAPASASASASAAPAAPAAAAGAGAASQTVAVCAPFGARRRRPF